MNLSRKQLEKILDDLDRDVNTIKRRLGFLVEAEALLRRRTRNAKRRAKNDVLFGTLIDSYSMLVIDLWSLFKDMMSNDGLLSAQLKYLKPLLWPPASMGSLSTYEKAVTRKEQERLFRKLFHAKPRPLADVDIDRLRIRVSQKTELLRNDRNHLRAHRYERWRSKTIPAAGMKHVRASFELLETVLDAIRLLGVGNQYEHGGATLANADEAAENIVALILHGNMQGVWRELGVTKALTGKSRMTFYWQFRDRYWRVSRTKIKVRRVRVW